MTMTRLASRGTNEELKMIIREGRASDIILAPGHYDFSVLETAIMTDQIDCLDKIMEAEIFKADFLKLAVIMDRTKVVEHLIGLPFSDDILSIAISNNNCDIVVLLLRNGCKASAPMLELACRIGNANIVKILLEAGLQVTKEAVDIARNGGFYNCLHVLNCPSNESVDPTFFYNEIVHGLNLIFEIMAGIEAGNEIFLKVPLFTRNLLYVETKVSLETYEKLERKCLELDVIRKRMPCDIISVSPGPYFMTDHSSELLSFDQLSLE